MLLFPKHSAESITPDPAMPASVSRRGRSNTYLEHFGLREMPFTLTPNTDFFINFPAFHKAVTQVRQAWRAGNAIIKITSASGTGKTLLCQHLLQTLGPGHFCVCIPDACLSPDGLVLALAEELGLPVNPPVDHQHLMGRVHAQLLALHAASKRPVLLLDEAQALPDESVETLRQLMNLEADSERLLQMVLFGQPELNDLLNRNLQRLLLQRVNCTIVLPTLQQPEVAQYINFRLNRAGCNRVNLFSPAALELLYRASSGVPLLLNRLCHQALLNAWEAGAATIETGHVVRASETVVELAPDFHHFGARAAQKARPAMLAFMCLAASGLTLFGVYIF